MIPMDERKDILELLKKNGFNRPRLDALEKCDMRRCSDPAHCREVCPFGRHRRIHAHSQSIARLLANETDLCEVRVSKASWSCGLNDLDPVKIFAVNNLNRRALDKIQESVLAVGTIKVFASPATDQETEDVWRWEIHEIVAYSSQTILEESFLPRRGDLDSYVCVRQIDDLGETIESVLSRDLVEWKHPRDAADPVRASKKWRREYYRWLLRLNANDRLIRYGCDRYFNRLKKLPRAGAKPKKPRPYPWQLTPYQYNRHDYNCRCSVCINQKNRG